MKWFIDLLGSLAKWFVNEQTVPANGYKSTVAIFGGRLRQLRHGRLLFDQSGFVSRLDRFGDAIVRRWDDAVEWYDGWYSLLSGVPLRRRGNPREVYANVLRLGLANTYCPHKNGIEMRDTHFFDEVVALQDIFRVTELSHVNRRIAVGNASLYLSQLHTRAGYVGEVLPSDILFQSIVGDIASKPILNVPDIVGVTDEIGTLQCLDFLDFVFSIAFEEYRRSRDLNETRAIVSVALNSYHQKTVKLYGIKFVEEEQYTLPDITDRGIKRILKVVMWQHNRARLNPPVDGVELQELIDMVKERLTTACTEAM